MYNEFEVHPKRDISLDYSHSLEDNHDVIQHSIIKDLDQLINKLHKNFMQLDQYISENVPTLVRQMITDLLEKIQHHAKAFTNHIKERNELMKSVRLQIKVYMQQTQMVITQYNQMKSIKEDLEVKLIRANKTIESKEEQIQTLSLQHQKLQNTYNSEIMRLEVQSVLDLTVERAYYQAKIHQMQQEHLKQIINLENQHTQHSEDKENRISCNSDKIRNRFGQQSTAATTTQSMNSSFHNRHQSHHIDSHYSENLILKGFSKGGISLDSASHSIFNNDSILVESNKEQNQTRFGLKSLNFCPNNLDQFKTNSSVEQSRMITTPKRNQKYFTQNDQLKYKNIRRQQELMKRSINTMQDKITRQGRPATKEEQADLNQFYSQYSSMKSQAEQYEQLLRSTQQIQKTTGVDASVQVEFSKLDLKEKETIIKELKADLKKKNQLLTEQQNKLKEQINFVKDSKLEIERLSDQISQVKSIEEKYIQKSKEVRTLCNQIEDMKGKVRVFCRVRPMLKLESGKNHHLQQGFNKAIVPVDDMTLQLNTKSNSKMFKFDGCYFDNSTQEEIFQDIRPLVGQAFDGFNVCVFAYGQTGSGKTFTMYGTNENPGLLPRIADEVFNNIECLKQLDCKVFTYITELYKDQLIDLLGQKSSLEIREDARGFTYIQNITTAQISSKFELLESIDYAAGNRKTSTTDMNDKSSRSHFIVTICLEVICRTTKKRTLSKICLIDLAGSERVNRSNPSPAQLLEAKSINKSLSALGDVISALSNPTENHIPYRNNKLTHLMKDSLGGNSKTVMIINLSPSESNIDETQIALTYGQRVKLITNEPIKNLESIEMTKLKEAWKKLHEENLQLRASQQHN